MALGLGFILYDLVIWGLGCFRDAWGLVRFGAGVSVGSWAQCLRFRVYGPGASVAKARQAGYLVTRGCPHPHCPSRNQSYKHDYDWGA